MQCIYEFFFWISEQTQIISPHNISLLVFKTEVGCVYCTVWTEFLNTGQVKTVVLKMYTDITFVSFYISNDFVLLRHFFFIQNSTDKFIDV
jgi:hypothetical protein